MTSDADRVEAIVRAWGKRKLYTAWRRPERNHPGYYVCSLPPAGKNPSAGQPISGPFASSAQARAEVDRIRAGDAPDAVTELGR